MYARRRHHDGTLTARRRHHDGRIDAKVSPVDGLLRQYFPKGTDLCLHSADELAAVAMALNTRPRKTLAWRTPAEMFDQALRLVQPAVATTG
jgi:hypothetical protein